ncbi:hypothetical protein BJX99DRAFT_266161 [Aspergillus californicus]
MDNLSTLNWKDSGYYCHYSTLKKERDACLERVDWKALCSYASSRNQDKPCSLLDKDTMGGVHLIRLLKFEDDTHWVARVQLAPVTPATASTLQAEIDTMELIRARTDIPVAKVFSYGFYDDNCVHASFTLMEFLPGSSAMDAEGGRDVHHGRIPSRRRDLLFEEVQLSSIRLPKIGSIIKREDNSFDIGPLPSIGGPFSTATRFFKAWAKYAIFPMTDSRIRASRQTGPIEDDLHSIHGFSTYLHDLANNISTTDNDHGPFPLYHPDLYQSNIVVDESFHILGVIDWGGACTVPWEVVEPPLFLSMVPPAMDDLNNYTADGEPNDLDSVRRLNERAQYIENIQNMEKELEVDQKLSTVLLDPACKELLAR